MRATVRPPVAVKLNTEKVKAPSLAEMREVTVRTEKERSTLLVDLPSMIGVWKPLWIAVLRYLL